MKTLQNSLTTRYRLMAAKHHMDLSTLSFHNGPVMVHRIP